MVYVVTTMVLFLVEMLCWGLRTSYLEHRRWVSWVKDYLPQDPILILLRHFRRTLDRSNTGKFTVAGRRRVKRMLECWERSRWTDHVDVLLKVMEVGNSIW